MPSGTDTPSPILNPPRHGTLYYHTLRGVSASELVTFSLGSDSRIWSTKKADLWILDKDLTAFEAPPTNHVLSTFSDAVILIKRVRPVPYSSKTSYAKTYAMRGPPINTLVAFPFFPEEYGSPVG